MTERELDVDALAQEIRRVDGSNSLGAGALAEALMPFLSRSTLPREGQGEVVALEWRELTSPREDGPPEPTGDVEAETMIGEYSICLDEDEGVADTPWCCWSPVECIGHFADIAEAKAAAQGDFASRIRSALVFNETASDDTQAALPVTGETQALSPSPAVRDGEDDVRQLLMAIENAARMSEQGILSADGGQAATEIRALVPLKFRRALSTQEQGNG